MRRLSLPFAPHVVIAITLLATSACDQPRYQHKTERQWRDELQSGEVDRRLWAANALAEMDASSDATRHALVRALEDTSVSVRVAAAKALAKRYDGRALRDYILDILSRPAADSTSPARISALEALGLEAYQHERSLPLLMQTLTDPSPAIRATAAVSLGMFKDKAKSAEVALEALMRDTNEIVRHEARDALSAITGRKYEH